MNYVKFNLFKFGEPAISAGEQLIPSAHLIAICGNYVLVFTKI